MKNTEKVYNVLLVIISVVIVIAIGIILLDSEEIKKTELKINVPEYIFVGETKEIDVKTNESPVIVVYKKGYLRSEQMAYEGTEFKIPFHALKEGIEEIDIRTINTNQQASVLVCPILNIKNKTITLTIGSSQKVEFNISEECLSKYNFEVVDKSIATYENKTINAKKVGTTKLNITRADETYVYTIKVEPKELKFVNNISSINVGESHTLKLANVTDNLNCTSSNSKILSVSTSKESCELDAKAPGSATITATSGAKKIKTTITVIQPVESIKFNSNSYSVRQGEKINASVTISPSNASNKTLKCSSNDNKIATVSASGSNCIVNGIKIGETKITAVVDGKSVSVPVKVTEPVTIVNLKVATWNLGRYGKTSQSSASVQANYFKLQNIDIAGFQEARPYSGSMATPLNTYVSITGLGHYRYHETPAGNAVLSKYSIISAQNKSLTSCAESRGLTKVVIRVNGVDISFYTTHFSYQSRCHQVHAESLASLVKNDPNPQIITGDFNIHNNDVLTPALGSNYKIVAYDTISKYYTDSILIKATDANGKVRIRLKNFDVLKTNGVYTDHNMVVANLEIIN